MNTVRWVLLPLIILALIVFNWDARGINAREQARFEQWVKEHSPEEGVEITIRHGAAPPIIVATRKEGTSDERARVSRLLELAVVGDLFASREKSGTELRISGGGTSFTTFLSAAGVENQPARGVFLKLAEEYGRPQPGPTPTIGSES